MCIRDSINIYNDQDYIINEQFVIELFKSIFSVEKGNNGSVSYTHLDVYKRQFID